VLDRPTTGSFCMRRRAPARRYRLRRAFEVIIGAPSRVIASADHVIQAVGPEARRAALKDGGGGTPRGSAKKTATGLRIAARAVFSGR
jgi:hypothetical protein